MKVLYLTLPCFADYMLSLTEAANRQGLDATCILDLNSLSGTIVNISERNRKVGLLKADVYPELEVFSTKLLDGKFYVLNYNPRKIYVFQRIIKVCQLVRFIRSERFDVIHIDHLLHGLDKILYIFRKKLVLTMHDPLQHSGMEFSKKTQKNIRQTFDIIPKIVIHNQSQVEEFCGFYGIKRQRVLLNPLAPYTCYKIYAKEGVSKNPHEILFFGRISKYKGVEYLCKAMVQVHKLVPDAKLYILGGGNIYFDYEPYKDLSYIELINEYASTEAIVERLQKCSFSVCPYIDATQSGVVMTCNALNVPVIATNVGGLPEMIEDGKSGLIIPPKDEDALANAMISLLQDRERLAGMSDYIKEMYSKGDKSPKEIIPKYKDFYQKPCSM